jgi:hypothetical protein
MRRVLLDHVRKSDPKMTGPRTGLQERRMVGVVGGNLRAVGKEASDLESALIFRDLETKVTSGPTRLPVMPCWHSTACPPPRSPS